MTAKFILAIRDALLSGVDTRVLESLYDEFVMLLFSKDVALTNKAAYHNTLVYTREELLNLREVSEKKCNRLPGKNPPVN